MDDPNWSQDPSVAYNYPQYAALTREQLGVDPLDLRAGSTMTCSASLPLPVGFPYRVYTLGTFSDRAQHMLQVKVGRDRKLLCLGDGEEEGRHGGARVKGSADLAECLQRHRGWMATTGGVQWPLGWDQLAVGNFLVWRPGWMRAFFAVDEEAVMAQTLTSRKLSGFLVLVDQEFGAGRVRTVIRPVTVKLMGVGVQSGRSAHRVRVWHYERYGGLEFNATVENLERMMGREGMQGVDFGEIIEPHWVLE